MRRKALVLLLVFVVGPWVCQQPGQGQEPTPAVSEPRPVLPSPEGMATPQPSSWTPSRTPFELLHGLQDAPPPGWFTGLQVDVVNVNTNFPWGHGAPLGWTAAPHVELGYQFEDGEALRLSYRFLGASGDADQQENNSGLMHHHGQLDLNEGSLDYLFSESSLWEYLRFRGEFGGYLRSLFLFDRVNSLGVIQENGKDSFGLGIHGGLKSSLALGNTGLALFGRAVGGVGLAPGTFTVSQYAYAPSLSLYRSSSSQERVPQQAQILLDGTVQVGLSWTLFWRERWLRLAGGYQADIIYYLGGYPPEELDTSGVFLRAEYHF